MYDFIDTQRLLNCVHNLNELNGVNVKKGDHHKMYLESCNEILFQYFLELKKDLKSELSALSEDEKILDDFEHYYHLLIQRCDEDFENYRKELHRDIILFGKYQIYFEYNHSLLKVLNKDLDKNCDRMKSVKKAMRKIELIFHEFIVSSFFHAQERFLCHHENKKSKVRLYVHSPTSFIQECEQKTKEHIGKMPRALSTDISLIDSKVKKYKRIHVKKKKDDITVLKRIELFLLTLIPLLLVFKNYKLKMFYKDVFAGIYVGILSISWSMSYSLIAGLPPVVGLYAGLFPKLIYPFFGTSKVACVGPSALQALLVSETLRELNIHNVSDKVSIAMMLAMICGIIQIFLGIFRFGFVINFLSNSVISGFTTASAICIGVSQLGNFLGIFYNDHSHVVHRMIYNILLSLNQLLDSWPNLLLGLISLLFVGVFRKYKIPIIKKSRSISIFKKNLTIKPFTLDLSSLPYYLFLVGSSIIFMSVLRYYFGNFSDDNQILKIKIIGKIDSGFPLPTIPFFHTFTDVNLDLNLFSFLFYKSFAIILVGFIEHISVTKMCAKKSHPSYEINSSQELMALGASCLVGGIFNGFPSASYLETIIANKYAKTQVFSFFSFLVILITVSFMTFLFHNLPMTILATMIFVTVVHLIDLKTLKFTFKTKKSDFILLLMAFFCTLFIGVVEGILLSSVLSIILIVYKSSRPKMVRLGRIPGSTNFRDISHFKEAITTPNILFLQFDYGIYFANISFFLDVINIQLREYECECYILILSFSSVNFIDSNGVIGLLKLVKILKKQNIELYFSHVKYNVYSVMFSGGLVEKVGRELFFLEDEDALIHAEVEINKIFEKREEEIREAKNKKVKSCDDIKVLLRKKINQKKRRNVRRSNSRDFYRKSNYYSSLDIENLKDKKKQGKKFFKLEHQKTISDFKKLNFNLKSPTRNVISSNDSNSEVDVIFNAPSSSSSGSDVENFEHHKKKHHKSKKRRKGKKHRKHRHRNERKNSVSKAWNSLEFIDTPIRNHPKRLRLFQKSNIFNDPPSPVNHNRSSSNTNEEEAYSYDESSITEVESSPTTELTSESETEISTEITMNDESDTTENETFSSDIHELTEIETEVSSQIPSTSTSFSDNTNSDCY